MTTPQQEYDRAADLYTRGRYDEAADVLQPLADASPDDIEVRHALAMCRQRLNRTEEAITHFRFVVHHDPARYEDAYRLGAALESQGAHREAADAYRLVLTHSEYLDTRQRLTRCQAAAGAMDPTAVLSPGSPGSLIPAGGQPMTLRNVIDEHAVAQRGRHTGTLRQCARYLAPAMGRATAAALATTALLAALPAVPRDWLAVFGLTPDRTARAESWLPLAIAVVWCVLAAAVGLLVLRAHLYTVQVFERGIDVAGGLLRRGRQFIWFYQMPLEPTYVRSGWMFLTGTASLHLKYNDLATNNLQLELPGIGTPSAVNGLRSYIEGRRLVERIPIRGPFS